MTIHRHLATVRRTSLPTAALLASMAVAVAGLPVAAQDGPPGITEPTVFAPFDPAAPAYFPKQKFLMLMRNERLAALDTRFDDATHVLTVRQNGGIAAQGDLRTSEGRTAIEAFFAAYSADELRGPGEQLGEAAVIPREVCERLVGSVVERLFVEHHSALFRMFLRSRSPRRRPRNRVHGNLRAPRRRGAPRAEPWLTIDGFNARTVAPL